MSEKEYEAKDIAALLDNIPSKDSLDKLLGGVTGIDSRLAALEEKIPEKTVAVVEDPEAEMEAKGFISDLMGYEIQGIPVAQAAVGGFVAIFASELVDGFMADSEDWKRGLVKVAVAAVTVKWGKKIFGSTGSKAIALLLTFDAIRDFTPIDSWADQLAEKISGTATTAGLAGAQVGGKKVNAQVEKLTSEAGYYGKALGGR